MGTPKPRPHAHNLCRHRLTCLECKRGFNAARPDAVFCSGKCKQKEYRDRMRAANLLAAQVAAHVYERPADDQPTKVKAPKQRKTGGAPVAGS